MIKINNLHKTLDNKKILKGLSLEIKDGETLVIIGRSGSGKSVLLKHILGIIKPDSGTIFIGGRNICSISDKILYNIRKKIGMVFQGSALFDSLNIAENVFFAMDQHTTSSIRKKYRTASEKLKSVGLKNILRKYPSGLSGGMKKRVAIARALAIEPDVILYDEPTTGLDPVAADVIDSLIKDLHKKNKVTSIVVTHDLNSAYKVADRIAMIYDGKIIAQGSVSSIKNSKDPIVSQFVNGLKQGPIQGDLV
jgi:phospholipid/cholesterol/gamma-HCH transport system ATP-binding protein